MARQTLQAQHAQQQQQQQQQKNSQLPTSQQIQQLPNSTNLNLVQQRYVKAICFHMWSYSESFPCPHFS